MKNMKKILVMALAAVLLVAVSVGGTIAYLTDKTETVENVFTTSNIDVKLEESSNLDLKMIPGKELTKDPTVTVIAGSEACWLFVKLEKSTSFDTYLSYNMAEGWTALDNVDGVYYREVAARLIGSRLAKEIESLPEFDMPKPLKKGGRKGADTVKIDLSIGRNKRIAPNFILGALVDATGLPGSDFGKIDIYDKFTTVEVPKDEADFILESMQQEKINGYKVSVKIHEERGGKEERFSGGDRQRSHRDGGRDNRGHDRRGGGKGFDRRGHGSHDKRHSSGGFNRKKRKG